MGFLHTYQSKTRFLVLMLCCMSCSKPVLVDPATAAPYVPLLSTTTMVKRISLTRNLSDIATSFSARPTNNSSNFDYKKDTAGEFILQLADKGTVPFIRIESANAGKTLFDIVGKPGTLIKVIAKSNGLTLGQFQLDDEAVFRLSTQAPVSDTTVVKNILYSMLNTLNEHYYTGY